MWAKVERISNALTLMLVGAAAVLCYLHVRLGPSIPEIEKLWNIIFVAFLLVSHLWGHARSKTGAARPQLAEPSPAWSGASVVIATGLAAAIFIGWDFHQPADLVMPALIMGLTSGIALLVFRFGRRHADQIGEARLNPTSRATG